MVLFQADFQYLNEEKHEIHPENLQKTYQNFLQKNLQTQAHLNHHKNLLYSYQYLLG